MTFQEAHDWWRTGNGQSLTVDIGKIDLSGISPADFPLGVGTSEVFNLLSPRHLGSVNDGLVYGSIRLTLGPNRTATSGFDIYDFDIQPWTVDNFARNIETFIARGIHGPGVPFQINFYGSGRLRP